MQRVRGVKLGFDRYKLIDSNHKMEGGMKDHRFKNSFAVMRYRIKTKNKNISYLSLAAIKTDPMGKD